MQILQPEFANGDKRRLLTQLLTEPIQQVNHYAAKKGAVLGNHFHKKTVEFFYIIKGTLLYNNLTTLTKGQLFVVDPGEVHWLKCLTDVKMFTFLTKAYNPDDPDIFKEKK